MKRPHERATGLGSGWRRLASRAVLRFHRLPGSKHATCDASTDSALWRQANSPGLVIRAIRWFVDLRWILEMLEDA
jgi:hypothetical protein